MILTSASRACVYNEAVDMRKSIDGLSQMVAPVMDMNRLSGQVFVFLGRRRDRAKLVVCGMGSGCCTSAWSVAAQTTRPACLAAASR